MSGGPVFDEEGNLRGLVCSNMAPDTPDGEHVSYVSTLWPLLGIPISQPWDPASPDKKFPLYEYATTGVIQTKHLERVKLIAAADGTFSGITCNYDAKEWSQPRIE